MKKFLSLILLALLPMSASAYDTYVNGIFYNLSGDEASVTYKYYDEENLTYDAGYSGNVVIPSSFTYNGKTYAVTGIGGCAFCESIGLTAVIIPESVKSIGSSAFKSCNSLTAVTIPGSVTSIGGSAFRGCSGLTSVTIGDGVTSIGDNAFQDCASLTSVAIPNSVTSIGGNAFRGCKGLTDVIIPDGVTNIGGSAFQNCSGLTSVTIAGSVKSIGGSAFNGCSSLTSVTIPEGLTKIENTTFGGCKSLNSVIIPRSVTSIGDNAFINCSSLTSVTVPESVISVGVSAFEGTAWYNNQQGLIYIGSVAYKYKGEMPEGTEISIREGTVQIAGEAFYTCTGLSSITIPESVTRISTKAFAGCTSLTSITLLESIKTIGSYAFAGCTSLTSITIPNGVTNIDTGVFNYCTGLTSVTIQDGVTSIGYEAFHDCYNLTSVKLPESLTTIGDRAFMYCQSLTSISIPKNVTKIGFSAFCQCKSLVTAVLPSSLKEIQEYALGNCDNLKDVYCYAENVPETEYLLFDESPISTATLHVPAGSVEKYKTTEPWSGFGNIVAMAEEIAQKYFPEGTRWTEIRLDTLKYDSWYSKIGDEWVPNFETIEYRVQGEYTYRDRIYKKVYSNGPEWTDSLAFLIYEGEYSGDNCVLVTGVIPENDGNYVPNPAETYQFDWSIGKELYYCDLLDSNTTGIFRHQYYYGIIDEIKEGDFGGVRPLKYVDLNGIAPDDEIRGRWNHNTNGGRIIQGIGITEWNDGECLFGPPNLWLWYSFWFDEERHYRSKLVHFERNGEVLYNVWPEKEATVAPVTFSKDQMATIILPTAPDASKGKYYKLDRCEDGMIVFEQETQPQARTPYIIVPNEDFSIDMSTLDVAGLSPDTVTVGGISFIGSYVRTELPALTGGDGGGSSSSYYDIIDQTPDCQGAASSTEMSIVGALRAYLVVTWDDPIDYGGTRSPQEKMELVLLDEGDSISRPTPDPSRNGGEVYDLSGRRVGNGKWIMDDGKLKPGIYIVGKKKVLMRSAK